MWTFGLFKLISAASHLQLNRLGSLICTYNCIFKCRTIYHSLYIHINIHTHIHIHIIIIAMQIYPRKIDAKSVRSCHQQIHQIPQYYLYVDANIHTYMAGKQYIFWMHDYNLHINPPVCRQYMRSISMHTAPPSQYCNCNSRAAMQQPASNWTRMRCIREYTTSHTHTQHIYKYIYAIRY